MEKYKYCNTTKTTFGNDNKIALHRWCTKIDQARGREWEGVYRVAGEM